MIIVSIILTLAVTTLAYRILLRRRKIWESRRSENSEAVKKILEREMRIAQIEREEATLKLQESNADLYNTKYEWSKSLEREVELEEKLANLRRVNEILRKEKDNRGYDTGRRSAIL
jgi:predicted Zn-dependent protease